MTAEPAAQPEPRAPGAQLLAEIREQPAALRGLLEHAGATLATEGYGAGARMTSVGRSA